MNRKTIASVAPALMIVWITILSCNLGNAVPSTSPAVASMAPTGGAESTLTPAVIYEFTTQASPTSTKQPVLHVMKPAGLAVTATTVYDVESLGTAPEHRTPYGDSYDLNRFERPFLQDMTYNPNLDLSSFTVGQDADWVYVSIVLVGNDPNDKLGIHYGVELDTDHDGFGDFIIWAHPPYAPDWDTSPVQIFRDTNHDTGGLSAEKSDAPLKGDGYDTLIFHGGVGDADPDIAWIRVNNGIQGLVQFAFKRSWSGGVFMLGPVADAGLKDPQQMDYVDRLKLADAGSPVRDNSNYPLKALFAVDNVCRAAFGFKPTGFEPQSCPSGEPVPKRTPKPVSTQPSCAAGELYTCSPVCGCAPP